MDIQKLESYAREVRKDIIQKPGRVIRADPCPVPTHWWRCILT